MGVLGSRPWVAVFVWSVHKGTPFLINLEGGEAAMLSSTASVEEISPKFRTPPAEVDSDVSDFQNPFLARSVIGRALQYSSLFDLTSAASCTSIFCCGVGRGSFLLP